MTKIRITQRDRDRYDRMSEMEQALHASGFEFIAGVDEAGRGPLAGPVYAAACILPKNVSFYGLNDSKKMTEKRREALFTRLVDEAESWAVASVGPREIDQINILEATKKAMRTALHKLNRTPSCALIDAVALAGLPYPVKAVIKGDATVNAIAAASVLAKVSRDYEMTRWHSVYPMYHFDTNKGYGTAEHIAALKQYGPCPLHRMSFLKNILAPSDHTLAVGSRTEFHVISHLFDQGFCVIGRNYKITGLGEIDLLAMKDHVLYVIEVKGRRDTSSAFGGAEEALSAAQRRRLKQVAVRAAESLAHEGDIAFIYAACDLDASGVVKHIHFMPFE